MMQKETLLGVAHIGGRYALTTSDYLNEGAAKAHALGARCIKVALSLDTENPTPTLYPFHSKWPSVETLAALAETAYFRALFARDFDAFVLTTFRPGRPAGYWRTELTRADEQAEEDSFAALTQLLLRAYSNRSVTFVLQNWEGDWALRGGFDPSQRPTREASQNMVRWLKARQRGVERGRRESPRSRAKVLHACEVNLVWQTIEKKEPGVATRVLPDVLVDLISYSAWDTKNNVEYFQAALYSLTKQERPVYIGEFGLPESEGGPELVRERTSAMLAVAKQAHCPYAIYWQLYCNEPKVTTPKTNADYKGFWVVRPDGTQSPVASLFRKHYE